MRRKPTIQVQMIGGFSAIILLMIGLIIFFSFRHFSTAIIDKTLVYYLESIHQLQSKMDIMLKEYDRASVKIAFSAGVQNYLASQKEGRTASAFEVERAITKEQGYMQSQFMVEIIDVNDRPIFTVPAGATQREPWADRLQAHGNMLWMGSHSFGAPFRLYTGHDNGLMGVRIIKDYYTFEDLGLMYFGIPIHTLKQAIEQFSTDEYKLQIVDVFGSIVYSTHESEIGHPLHADIRDRLSGRKQIIRDEGTHGVPMYIAYSKSPYSGLTVLGYLEERKAARDLRVLQKGILTIGLLCILASVVLITFYSWTLSRPIRQLAKRLQSMRHEEPKPIRARTANYELSILYHSFNVMIQSLHDAVNRLAEKQNSEQKAEIIALKAQFRPHFLYNSLNMIYYYATEDGNDKVAEMAYSLSKLLRYIIQPGSEFVKLAEDLEHLRLYLGLQKLRYEDKLNVSIEVEDERLNDYPVMKLLLLPLVENAITHGLEAYRPRDWFVGIRVSSDGEDLLIEVEDNGRGMEESKMIEVLQFTARDGGDAGRQALHSGIGLANLHRRIGLVYGDRYGLTLSKSRFGGLKVDVRLPRNPEGREEP